MLPIGLGLALLGSVLAHAVQSAGGAVHVSDVRFVGKGCSISTASASMMTESVKGKTRAEAAALFERFHTLVTGAAGAGRREPAPELGKLAAFSGVSEFPMRVKCATLAWHTLKAAFEGGHAPVSTE